MAVRKLLAGRDGFRCVDAPVLVRGHLHSVRWGAPLPDGSEDGIVADGMHYGYSDEAIDLYVRKYGHPSGTPHRPSRLKERFVLARTFDNWRDVGCLRSARAGM
ncbi:DUF6302 family protein [Streptomyces californicus]|uniref:DUF6302 family protein n=1 Tax=Streptomyces californicus TaxID=67351 RepID=UPI003802B325